MSKARGPYRVDPLGYKKAQKALDKMAENARELGLDYEPRRWAVFCQGCRKEWTVSYPHPGKSICADCDDKLAEQPAQQAIHCKHRRENNGVCPHHNLHCGWPKCNEPEQPAQQKPVAMQMDVIVVNLVREGINKHRARELAEHFIAHTSPPAQRAWVGLTDEEIERIFNNWPTYHLDHEEFARAIEAILREKNL